MSSGFYVGLRLFPYKPHNLTQRVFLSFYSPFATEKAENFLLKNDRIQSDIHHLFPESCYS